MVTSTYPELMSDECSCSPNANSIWDLPSFSMALFATRPILHGEEITIEYTKLTESRQTRRGRLSDMYNFYCGCDSCNISDSDAAMSDANRLELEKRSQTKLCSPLQWCKNLSLPDSYLVDGHTRCISLHEKEGIINMEYAMHITELAIVYGMLADAKNFKLWGLKAQSMLEIMTTSSGSAGPWKQWLANPKVNFQMWNLRMMEKAHR